MVTTGEVPKQLNEALTTNYNKLSEQIGAISFSNPKANLKHKKTTTTKKNKNKKTKTKQQQKKKKTGRPFDLVKHQKTVISKLLLCVFYLLENSSSTKKRMQIATE